MAVLITVPRQTRQGTFTTPSIVLDPSVQELLIKLNVTNATYNTFGKSVRMRFYFLDIDIWRHVATAEWQSGPYTDPETGEVNPPPVLSHGLERLRGHSCRAEIEIPVSMSIGATIETIP